MAKRVAVPISTARKQLFQLAELVRKSGDDTVVVLEQRGVVEPVALVREARLAYLEASASEAAARKPFTVAGSLRTGLDEDNLDKALRELRLEWTAAKPPAPRQRGR